MTPKVLVWFYMFASAFIAFTYAKLRIVATEACGRNGELLSVN